MNTTFTKTVIHPTVVIQQNTYIQYDDKVVTIYENVTSYNVSRETLSYQAGGVNPLFLYTNSARGPGEDVTYLLGTATQTGGVVV
jgi:hypothetical protein